MKKLYVLLTVAFGVLMLLSCGRKDEKMPDKKTDIPQIEQNENKEESTVNIPESEPAAEEEPAEAVKTEDKLISAMITPEADYVAESINDTWYILSEYSCEHINLNKEDEERYPALKASVDSYNEYISNQSKKYMDEYAELAREQIMDTEEDPFGRSVYSSTACITRADESAFSFTVDYYAYAGGAHPNTWMECFNFNPQTGEEIDISYYVKDMKKAADIITEKLFERFAVIFDGYSKQDLLQMVNDLFELSPVYDDDGKPTGEMKYGFEWSVGYQGIDFYFNTYTLSYYAAGMQQVSILIGEEDGVLYDERLNPPANYVTQPAGMFPQYDINHDCISDDFDLYSDMEYVEERDVYLKKKLYMTLGDKEYTDENFYSDGDVRYYIAHLSDGSEFLLVPVKDMWTEKVNIYDIKDDIKFIGSEDGSITNGTITDPLNIRLEKMCEIAGTFFGIKNYRLTDKGELVSDDEEFDISTVLTMKPSEDIKLPVVDKKENVITEDDFLIKKDTELVPVATDGKTYLDLFDNADDVTVRLEIEIGEEPREQYLKNGQKLDEVFDEIFWAN